jgi:Co/Zn/Cd efflux system component
MASCCEDKSCALDALKQKQSKTLKIVLAINLIMFFIVFVSGLLASSTALLSDSLDDLGDAITYALSLYVVYRSNQAKSKVALLKGYLILVAGLYVLSQVIYHLLVPTVPIFQTMGVIALLALIANIICLILLTQHKNEDINMSSVWECSRNDIATNLSVIIAAGLVWLTHAGWPDVLVGFVLSMLLIKSSIGVIKAAKQNQQQS